MQVLGEGIARAKPSKRKYVTLISHGHWNDIHSSKDREKYKSAHDGWSYEEIVEAFASEKGRRVELYPYPRSERPGRDASGKRLFDGLNTNRDRFSWASDFGGAPSPGLQRGKLGVALLADGGVLEKWRPGFRCVGCRHAGVCTDGFRPHISRGGEGSDGTSEAERLTIEFKK